MYDMYELFYIDKVDVKSGIWEIQQPLKYGNILMAGSCIDSDAT